MTDQTPADKMRARVAAATNLMQATNELANTVSTLDGPEPTHIMDEVAKHLVGSMVAIIDRAFVKDAPPEIMLEALRFAFEHAIDRHGNTLVRTTRGLPIKDRPPIPDGLKDLIRDQCAKMGIKAENVVIVAADD